MEKILLVEDNDVTSKAIKSILEKNGYLVTETTNGKEAIDIIGNEEFDIVITDLMLPYVNGLEIIQKVKTDVGMRQVKIMVISAIATSLPFLKLSGWALMII